MDPTAEEFERWRMPRYFAELWWCGDEVCDCYQPQIELITPNLTVGFPWIRRTRLWEGTFATDGGTRGQQEELERACARHGIPLGESLAWQDWPFGISEDVDALEMAIAHAEGTKPNALFRGGPWDNRAVWLGEPPPPVWYVPLSTPPHVFVVKTAIPVAEPTPRVTYRIRSRRPLIYEIEP